MMFSGRASPVLQRQWKLAMDGSKHTKSSLLSGPVLAVRADLWLKYGTEYIFTAVVGFSVTYFDYLEAFCSTFVNAAQSCSTSGRLVEVNGNSRKARAMFNGGTQSFFNNPDNMYDRRGDEI